MDAKRNMAKEPQPREGETRHMEGLGLESVIERAQGHDAEALGEIYRRYVRRVIGLCRYMLNSDSPGRHMLLTTLSFMTLPMKETVQRKGKNRRWSRPYPHSPACAPLHRSLAPSLPGHLT